MSRWLILSLSLYSFFVHSGTTHVTPRSEQFQVYFSVCFYMVTSITMVMANKWILNDHHYPLTFLWLQVVVAVILLHLTSAVGVLKAPHMTMEVSKALAPMIAVNVIGLSLNTLCLQYVDASFYQVPAPPPAPPLLSHACSEPTKLFFCLFACLLVSSL
jgi:GDP-fucose transporter C1